MPDMGTPLRWNTVEQAVKEISARRDDFDSAKLRIPEGQWSVGVTIITGAFLEVQLCDGTSRLLSVDVAEALLNDGILSRLRIPLKLDLERRFSPPDQDHSPQYLG